VHMEMEAETTESRIASIKCREIWRATEAN